MKKTKGFTLVELLVVIGIIALLISILLPSLNRAKWQAKIVQCSARMHDMLLAVQMYANDNKGYLPPFGGDDGKPTYTMGNLGGSASINIAYQQTFNFHPTNTVRWDDGALMGRLYRTKYLKTTKTFYCPSVLDAPDPTVDKPNFRFFGDYVLNPHVCYKDAALTISQPWWKRLPNYGKISGVTGWSGTVPATGVPVFRRAILTDPIYANNPTGSGDDLKYITHAAGKRRAFNMGYADGSVLTYIDSNWAARRADRWTTYLDLSNAIQHNLDGGSVNFSAGGWQNTVYGAIPIVP